jgi:hypothetical protein
VRGQGSRPQGPREEHLRAVPGPRTGRLTRP